MVDESVFQSVLPSDLSTVKGIRKLKQKVMADMVHRHKYSAIHLVEYDRWICSSVSSEHTHKYSVTQNVEQGRIICPSSISSEHRLKYFGIHLVEYGIWIWSSDRHKCSRIQIDISA